MCAAYLRRTRRGIQLALLVLMVLGTMDAVVSAVLAQDQPPPGVCYDWALALGHAFAMVSCFSALGVLIIDAGQRLWALTA
jgi:hypothetical protein